MKPYLFLIALFLISFVEASIQEDVNNYLEQNNIDVDFEYASDGFLTKENNHLFIAKEDKVLVLDLLSFKSVEGFSKENKIQKIIADSDYPEIIFLTQNRTISITQEDPGTTNVRIGVPEKSQLVSRQPLVYVVEHYDPDKRIIETSRKTGNLRLAIISNTEKADIDNSGISLSNSKISTKSFLNADYFENAELDFLGMNTVTEVFTYFRTLYIRTFDRYTLDEDYDRGFMITGSIIKHELIQHDLSISSKTMFVDVTNEDCSKLGFVILPGYGYSFLNQTRKLTGVGGFVLGIATAQNRLESSLDDVSEFVEKSTELGLKPIVRILGKNWQQDVFDEEEVIAFINSLQQKTDGKLEYVQIWDKPNVVFGENEVFKNPHKYADYVKNIKEGIGDIKVIPGSLSTGESKEFGENYRVNSDYYLNELLNYPEFWGAIDFWGSSIYNPLENKSSCINAELEFYSGQEVCSYGQYSYRWELEKINSKIGKRYDVVITEIGYPVEESNYISMREMLEMVKSDPYVYAGIVMVGNGWNTWESSSWIEKETKQLNDFAYRISEEVCG